MKKYIYFYIIILIIIGVCLKLFNKKNENKSQEANKKYMISVEYKRNDITIYYPQFENDNQLINSLIKNESLNVLMYYEEPYLDLSLNINYEIKLISNNLLSIVFSGVGYTKGAAHPNNLFYTLNINLKTGEKMVLKDSVKIDELFINLVGKYAKQQLDSRKYESFTRDYGDNNKIEKYLNNADTLELGIGNQFDAFSYITNDLIGISLPVSHSIGDHIEINIPIKEVK